MNSKMSTTVEDKKIVFHIGDLVTIINPEVFIRVGYPLTRNYALEVAQKEYTERVYAFMREVSPEPELFTVHNSDPRLYGDLVDALASYWLRLNNYGGKERRIYTEPMESLRHTKGWRVVSKRIVKTGVYAAGGYYGGNAVELEPDYSPPYLANEKHHVLLTLDHPTGSVEWLSVVEIEASNVSLDQAVKTANGS